MDLWFRVVRCVGSFVLEISEVCVALITPP